MTTIFGYNVLGSNTNAASSYCRADVFSTARYVAAAGDIISKITFGSQMAAGYSGTIDVGVYTFAGGVPVTKIDLATITITGNNTFAWYESGALSIALTDGVTYVLVLGNPTGDLCNYLYDTGFSDGESYYGVEPLPGTWTEQGRANDQISMYATIGSPPAPSGGVGLFFANG
jgi:hypothetical protein